MIDQHLRAKVVLLFGSGKSSDEPHALSSESSLLSRLIEEASGDIDISVISMVLPRQVSESIALIRLDESNRSLMDKFLAASGLFALRERLASFPLGRLLNSLGPVDRGRVFWRSVRRSPEALSALKSATAVIAADPAAVKTAWIALHRGWADQAFYDRRSASVSIGGQTLAR